jgi:Uma2 family endonuclease
MSTQLLEKKKWSYEDYTQLDGEHRYEVIEGELVMAPSPMTKHQRISGRLETLLRNFVVKRKLGEVFDAPFDVILSPDNVFQPDILFISNENMGILTEKNVQGAPDLIVEILSPGTAVYDLGIKKEVYERTGVKEFWIIDPESNMALVYQNGEKGFEITGQAKKEGTLKSIVLKGFKINIEKLSTG